jgi:FAD synthetase
VDTFVTESEADYKLALVRYAMPMKTAFAKYLEDKPRVKAIFVGTRRTDPHGALLTHFDATDQGWPAFMRVHPVIDWHYVEIWAVSCSFYLSTVGEVAGCGLICCVVYSRDGGAVLSVI